MLLGVISAGVFEDVLPLDFFFFLLKLGTVGHPQALHLARLERKINFLRTGRAQESKSGRVQAFGLGGRAREPERAEKASQGLEGAPRAKPVEADSEPFSAVRMTELFPSQGPCDAEAAQPPSAAKKGCALLPGVAVFGLTV